MFPIVSTWSDVHSEIISKYCTNPVSGGSPIDDDKSRKHLLRGVNAKLKSPLYSVQNYDSVINTLRYIFWETRAGIFVSIRNNKVEAFIPFANARYKNDWSNGLTFKGVRPGSKNPVKEYLSAKRKAIGYSRAMGTNPVYWWANQHFLNVNAHPDVWGQHSLIEYHDMITTTLKDHSVANVQFFINKRDHALLRGDLRKPYTFLYKGEVPMIKNLFSAYAPILSPYAGDEYLDICMPIAEDWLSATKPSEYYGIENDVAWEDKVETAFFRGSATGRVNNNPRIKLSQLSYKWGNMKTKSSLLDAGITSWNLSDKVDANGFVEYINPKELESTGVSIKQRIPMNDQVGFKYLINVDGHTRTNRTNWLMQSGSLMMVVDSTTGDKTWTDEVIKPWKHYVPIKADLSDLEEQILWCRNHDKECKAIVKRAKETAKLCFSRETITGYMSYTLNAIAAKRG